MSRFLPRSRAGLFLSAFLPFAIGTGDVEALTADMGIFQVLEYVVRHIFGQVDKAEIILDVDVADVFRVEAGFIGDRAHDIAGFDPLPAAHLDTKALHAFARNGFWLALVLAAFRLCGRRVFLW